jgi:hypothetical protein
MINLRNFSAPRRWIVIGICLYLVLCVLGLLLLLSIDSAHSSMASLSGRELLFAFFIFCPVFVLTYGLLEWVFNLGFRATGRTIARVFRGKQR